MKNAFGKLARKNVKLAKGKWTGALNSHQLQVLRSLTEDYGFALALGDLLLLDGGWYVTHAGLLRLATRSRCNGIRVEQVPTFCDPVAARWVFKAVVYKSPGSKGFVGYGDADPSNVSTLLWSSDWSFWNRSPSITGLFSADCTAPNGPCGGSIGFFEILATTLTCLTGIKSMKEHS